MVIKWKEWRYRKLRDWFWLIRLIDLSNYTTNTLRIKKPSWKLCKRDLVKKNSNKDWSKFTYIEGFTCQPVVNCTNKPMFKWISAFEQAPKWGRRAKRKIGKPGERSAEWGEFFPSHHTQLGSLVSRFTLLNRVGRLSFFCQALRFKLASVTDLVSQDVRQKFEKNNNNKIIGQLD